MDERHAPYSGQNAGWHFAIAKQAQLFGSSLTANTVPNDLLCTKVHKVPSILASVA